MTLVPYVLYGTRLTPGKLNVSWSVFHLPKNSGNPVWDVNETRLFGSFHWKLFGINRISEKVVPFSSKLPNGICVPFTDFSSLSPVQYLTRSFKRPGLPGLPWMELVTNGTRFSQTEIPNRNFPKFVLNGNAHGFCRQVSKDVLLQCNNFSRCELLVSIEFGIDMC